MSYYVEASFCDDYKKDTKWYFWLNDCGWCSKLDVGTWVWVPKSTSNTHFATKTLARMAFGRWLLTTKIPDSLAAKTLARMVEYNFVPD